MPQYNAIQEIVIANDGKVLLRIAFGDGSSAERELRERAGNIFEQIGSAHGDKYRIVPSTGDLHLLDYDGWIRVATRLANTQQDDECQH